MKRLNEKILSLGKNPSKEIGLGVAIALVLLLAGVGAYFLFRIITLPIFGILLSLIFLIYYFNRYDVLLKEKDEKATLEFIEAFTYFSIHLSNGYNVYRAFEEAAALSKENVKPYLEELLEGIDNDKGLSPYLKFASHFASLTVKDVMLSVYQMVEEGENKERVRQFQDLFSSFSQDRHQKEKEDRRSLLGKLESLPLIGSGATILMVTAAVIAIIGEYYHVL
jgi:hypothetical protein